MNSPKQRATSVTLRLVMILLPALAAWALPGNLAAQQQAAQPPADYVRANFTKYEYRIAMRDGARLFTSVYVPKNCETRCPILLNRTPYSVAPYGVDQYRTSIGPSEQVMKDGYIIAYQDVRGRYMSDGSWIEVRPHIPDKKSKTEVDESADTWDTIDWLVKNIPGNNGLVGMWGVSYPGFYVSAGMIDAHPALKAASPQAPVTDYYLGDDSFHNGAFMLAANFGFYAVFKAREGGPKPPPNTWTPYDYGTPDGYEFFLTSVRCGPAPSAPGSTPIRTGASTSNTHPTTSSGRPVRSGASSGISRRPCWPWADGSMRRILWDRCALTARSGRRVQGRTTTS